MAITKKGSSSRCEVCATVTCFSCMASSSADCVFGVARLISSASSRLVNIGPGWKPSDFLPSPFSCTTDVPITSAGIRSGVNWMREYFSATACASVRTSIVLPEARRALQQHVPAGQQGDQHALDHFRLADDRLGNFPADLRHFFGEKFRLLAEGLAARLAFCSHRTGHESILVLAGSPSVCKG